MAVEMVKVANPPLVGNGRFEVEVGVAPFALHAFYARRLIDRIVEEQNNECL